MYEVALFLFLTHAYQPLKSSNIVKKGTCSFTWFQTVLKKLNDKCSKVFEIFIFTLFSSPTANIGPLLRGQLHSSEVSQCWVPKMVECLVGFESGTFPFDYNVLTH